MFANRRWQQVALLMNLAGTVLLFYSFQATSSAFRVVTFKNAESPTDLQYALCVSDTVLVAAGSKQGMTLLGARGCPSGRSVAVVNIEHPFFESLGFFLLFSGFLLQFFSIPQPETVAHFRQQLKLAKIKDRQKLNRT